LFDLGIVTGGNSTFARWYCARIQEYEKLTDYMVRTRVLLYVPSLEIGGTERKVARLACGLDQTCFEPIVAWSDRWGPIGDRLESAGIRLCRLHAKSQDHWEEQLRGIAPDIFHSFSYRKDALDVLAATAAQIPLIVTTRVNSREWDPEGHAQDWEHVRNRLTHRISAVSKAAAAICVRVEGQPPEKITVIHNGVPIPQQRRRDAALRAQLGLGDSVQLVGFVANYRPEKNHEFLLKSFRSVLDLNPNVHLVCCGSDPFGRKAGLQNLAAELGIERQVRLLDSIENVNVVYGALDIYVQPSMLEGFSNSILEAMAQGLPVVATNVGGNPEAVLDGMTGILVPLGNTAALAEAIVSLLDDPQRGRLLGEAGAARVSRRFSLTAMVEAHEHLYDELRPRPNEVPPRRDDGRIRVLLHLDYLWSGGLEKKVENLVLGLDKTRFEPILSWSRKWGPVGRRIEESGVPVVMTAMSRPSAIARIREIAPDIFHSFSCSKTVADVTAARQAGVPVVITNRSSMRYWEGGEAVQPWEVARNHRTDKIIACSDAVAEVCSEVERLPASMIAVVHNGVAIPGRSRSSRLRGELHLRDSTQLIGYAATYRDIKGHEFLLHAFRRVLDSGKDAHLVCLGEDYDDTRLRLQNLASDLDITTNISLLDAREDVAAIYDSLSIYVHPSLTEGFSNAILEAMAHGLPVVAAATGGTPEAVADEITGILVSAADSAALADALHRLLEDTELRQQMGIAGRERVKQRFSMARMVEGYQDVYEKVLARHEDNLAVPAHLNEPA
jgi:glycosyltransferase involved in cell wall biosynthesis